MSDERYARVKRAMEPPWDDLREQRVLARVQEERRARLARRPARVYVLSAIAAALVAGLLALTTYRLRGTASDADTTTAAARPASKMLLADGSEVALLADAEVKLEHQATDEVRLLQTSGGARYDVTPNPQRRFSVRAGDVVVRVLGTAFTVTLTGSGGGAQASADQERVRVEVVRGHVEVDFAGKVTALSAGETLEVPRANAQNGTGNAADNGVAHEPAPAPTIAAPMPEKKPAPATVEQLLARADQARGEKRYDDAAAALRTMLQSFPSDPRAASASFTLGRVERARGRHAAAAESFARCHRAAPHGSLAEDALAEEAISWKNAGDTGRARTAAKRYLEMHPGGAHAARIMPLRE